MKKVLVLGAGRGQVGLIRAAHKLGHHVIVASIPGDYPGFPMADEIVYADLRDPDAISGVAKDHKVDGVVVAGADLALPALGAACEDNHLPGPDRLTSRKSSDKSLMKAAFEKCGVRTAKHYVAYTLGDAKKAPSLINMPVVVKAIDLGGSRGVNIVFREEDLEKAFKDTMSVTRADHCVIEEYIDGYEVSATAMVAGGEVLCVLPMGDLRYGENDEIPVGHYVPLECGPEICEDIEVQCRAAIKAVGLDDCAVNADLMIMDGKAYVLELTGRLGANAIPEITSAYYGHDIHEDIVLAALGEYDKLRQIDYSTHTDKVVYGQMMISETGGVLGKASVDDEDCDAWFFKKEGDAINKFRNPGDCIGQVVVIGDTMDECREHVDRILEGLEIN